LPAAEITMEQTLYNRILHRKYTAAEAIIILGIYVLTLIAYTLIMV